MIIGLTGGIGTGKSTVSRYLEGQYHFEIIDADKISREIVEPGSPLLRKLADAFGERFILSDGSLDRKALGKYVFEDAKKKEILDDIMMGEILSITRARKAAAKGHAIIDAPLLFEVGLDKDCDMTWLVDADTDVRIARVVARDGISEQEVRDRISLQMDRDAKIALADVVIDNSGTEEELHHRIDELVKEYV